MAACAGRGKSAHNHYKALCEWFILLSSILALRLTPPCPTPFQETNKTFREYTTDSDLPQVSVLLSSPAGCPIIALFLPPGGRHGGSSAATQVSGVRYCSTVSRVMALCLLSGALAEYRLSEVEQVFKVVRIHGEFDTSHSVSPSCFPPPPHPPFLSHHHFSRSLLISPFLSLSLPLTFPSSGSLHSDC